MATLEEEVSDDIYGWESLFETHGIAEEFWDDVYLNSSVSWADQLVAVVTDGATLSSAAVALAAAGIRETVSLAEAYSVAGVLGVLLAEVVALRDSVSPGFAAEVADSITTTDTVTLAHGMTVLEAIGLTETIATAAKFGASWADTVRLTDALLRFVDGSITEVVSLTDVLTPQQRAQRKIADGVEITGTATPRLLVSAIAADHIRMTASWVLNALYQPHIREHVELSVGYASPGGGFTTWAMNTRTGAVTEYDNFSFNSFARIGNKYIGATDQGLYELNGDTDDGDDIIARIKSGYMQFGGVHLSRLKAAYIGMRGEGEFVLRIITGDGSQYDYSVDTRDMRTTKVHMGKGQRARYFAFELISSGSDFDLDTIEFVPLVLQRRV
jgi:hypothetical protein